MSMTISTNMNDSTLVADTTDRNTINANSLKLP